MTATQEPEGNEEETQTKEQEQEEVDSRAEAAAEEARVHQEHRNVDETRESMRVEASPAEEEVTPEDNS